MTECFISVTMFHLYIPGSGVSPGQWSHVLLQGQHRDRAASTGPARAAVVRNRHPGWLGDWGNPHVHSGQPPAPFPR